jgi:hypothetical protein
LAGAFADEVISAALGSAHLPIVEEIVEPLERLLDPPLAAALLRRAEEHRLARDGAGGLVGDLTGDPDPATAAAAMALLILASGRVDGFGEPVFGRFDLPAEVQHRLTWRTAASLRHYLVARHDVAPGEADRAVAAAAADWLARYDEGEGIDARALRLARRLDETGRLDDALFARLLAEAGLPLMLAALAARTNLAPADLWPVLADRHGAPLLLRASGIGRDAAARILLQLGTAEAGLADRLGAFDASSAAEADLLLSPWRADPAYRDAIVDLGG